MASPQPRTVVDCSTMPFFFCVCPESFRKHYICLAQTVQKLLDYVRRVVHEWGTGREYLVVVETEKKDLVFCWNTLFFFFLLSFPFLFCLPFTDNSFKLNEYTFIVRYAEPSRRFDLFRFGLNFWVLGSDTCWHIKPASHGSFFYGLLLPTLIVKCNNKLIKKNKLYINW